MFTGNPYTLDYTLWPLMDPEDRWIFNKLELLVRLGIEAEPCGTIAPAGDYCVRPIMNLYGMAGGGFFKIAHPGGRIRNRPGYFWTPWVNGPQTWSYYLLDAPQRMTMGALQPNGQVTVQDRPPASMAAVPTELLGISRYLQIERIGNTIIEVSPRHAMIEARQNIIDDYLAINPAWDQTDTNGDPLTTNRVAGMKRKDYGQDEWGLVGWRWEPDETTWITV